MALDVGHWRDVAAAAATAADEVALRYFGGRLDAERKADGSFVTAADREVEAVVREHLRGSFPILGEEGGGAVVPGEPTWVVDPIDATNNFLRGIPVFATLIGLVLDGEAIVGVVSAPALGERWEAARGLGAARNGRPATVSQVSALAAAQVLHGGLDWWRDTPERWETLGRITDAVWRTRGFGDFWMHLLVAGGHAEAAVERDLKPWDVAAVACVVAEAGGRITSWDGGSALDTGEALSSNGRVHGELLALLSG